MPLKDTVKAIVVSMSMLSFLVFPTGCAAQNQSQGTGSPPVQAPANQNSVKQPDRDTNETTSKKKPVQTPGQVVSDPKQADAPKIPHSAKDNSKCLNCHKDGIKGAQKTPHPERVKCLDCHTK